VTGTKEKMLEAGMSYLGFAKRHSDYFSVRSNRSACIEILAIGQRDAAIAFRNRDTSVPISHRIV
jgi:hypothetical protein